MARMIVDLHGNEGDGGTGGACATHCLADARVAAEVRAGNGVGDAAVMAGAAVVRCGGGCGGGCDGGCDGDSDDGCEGRGGCEGGGWEGSGESNGGGERSAASDACGQWARVRGPMREAGGGSGAGIEAGSESIDYSLSQIFKQTDPQYIKQYCGSTTQLNMINQNLERVGIQEDEALENAKEKLLVSQVSKADELMANEQRSGLSRVAWAVGTGAGIKARSGKALGCGCRSKCSGMGAGAGSGQWFRDGQQTAGEASRAASKRRMCGGNRYGIGRDGCLALRIS
ncbi:hypothetical protein DFH08DRAFT_827281 [Mycena albidolilacea]|uniref:Uncharacterized protein n=1 Tax=Mycena albidolilacea TaxID=1033008 RepID=A0AAD6YZM5_9AGAR|nr:hypothetical protein DFH08DRAFT_827281 [Mycena albidolilacea]